MSKSDLGSWTPITSPKTAELFPNQFIRKKNIDFTPTTVNSNKLTDPPTCFTNVKGGGGFHDSAKMPKHVEMIRTKCQPKIWDGQNANHREKSGQNANLWLALCPVGILSGWHFVLPPNCQALSLNHHYTYFDIIVWFTQSKIKPI